MRASKCSFFSLSFHFVTFLLVIIQATSFRNCAHGDFVECLELNNSNSNSSIYTPKNSSYLSILKSRAPNLRCLSNSPFKPILILVPSQKYHESQIQVVIHCAQKHGIQIRVRCGGHDFEGLSYTSTSPFVLVDLKNLRSILVDTENHTAWIQASATLGDVYYEVAKRSETIAFVAGTCTTVGVGGQLSGGGYGMMSRKFGLAVDQVIDAKLIDVNGRILNRQSMGEDLFWAIRGGGGVSFGIIIAWKVKLVSIPRKLTVFNLTRTLEQNVTQLVHKWQYIADKIDENLVIRVTIRSSNTSPNGKRALHFSFTSLFIGGVDELLQVMQASFPELGLLKKDCFEMSWIQTTLYFAGIPTIESIEVLMKKTPTRGYYKAKSDYVNQPISENGLNGMWEILWEEDEKGAFLEFSPYGGRMSEISEFATPFPHRAGNIYMILYEASWDKNAQSTTHTNWIRRLYDYMSSYVSNFPRAAYLNYRDLDLGVNNEGNPSHEVASVWGVKYFKNNFERLVHVKTRVDPSNFFRNEQSIPPRVASWDF